jgi:hypothetical protein
MRIASSGRHTLSCFFISCLFLLQPLQTVAEQPDDDWHFGLLFPMVWAPDIKGDIQVGDDTYSVKIPFDEKIKDLNTGFIGEFYAQKDNWIAGVKLNYMRSETEEDTEGKKIPGGPALVAPHRVATETEEGIFDVILGYRVSQSLVVYGGVRRFGQKLTFDITPLEDDGLGFDKRLKLVDESYQDGILGLTWTWVFNERWSLVVSGDGNIAGDSDLNLFLESRVRFKISKLNSLWFGYRGSRIKLSPDTDGDRITTDFKQHGPTIGWAFTF